jgi:predicted  nucleic acid-binding Zn-ribbon protein
MEATKLRAELEALKGGDITRLKARIAYLEGRLEEYEAGEELQRLKEALAEERKASAVMRDSLREIESREFNGINLSIAAQRLMSRHPAFKVAIDEELNRMYERM